MHIRIVSFLLFTLIWLSIVGAPDGGLGYLFLLLVPTTTLLLSIKFDLIPKKNRYSIKLVPYIFWLLKEVASSALTVVKITYRPNLGISPVVAPIKSIQDCDDGIVLYANSITLTPGTVTVNISENNLLVHALDVSIIDDLQEGDMDKRIKEVMKQC